MDTTQVNYDALSPDELARILSQLFQPNTDIIKHATAILKEYFKRISALENLLILMATNGE